MATEILKLTKDCPEATIKSYFQGILKLTRENKEFPVDLDDVWMLIYSRRDKAISSLREHFILNIDYIIKKDSQSADNQFLRRNAQNSEALDKPQTKVVIEVKDEEAKNGSQSTDNQFFHQKVENSKRGRPIEKYYLSVSCLEFFIARKVRPVFEVYRQVFHRVAEGQQKKKTIGHKPTSREQLRLTTESTREEVESYFIELKLTAVEDNKFPVPVDEVWGMRFSAKRRVMDKLLGRNGQPNIYVYDRDYVRKVEGRNRKEALGEYYMTLKTFEEIMVNPIPMYREVFEKVFCCDDNRCMDTPPSAPRKPEAKVHEQKSLMLDSIITLYEINKLCPSYALEEVMENMMKISKEL